MAKLEFCYLISYQQMEIDLNLRFTLPTHSDFNESHSNQSDLYSQLQTAAPHVLNQRDGAGGEFPLHIAVRRGSVELASVMLKNGAKANCSNMHGLTPLHYAARLGNLDMISLLLSHGAFIGQVESFFWTPLHYAVYHGWEQAVSKLLETAAATTGAAQLVNETDSLARSALHVACRQGHLSIAAKLLAHGAQLVKDSSGHSPFYYLSVKVRL